MSIPAPARRSMQELLVAAASGVFVGVALFDAFPEAADRIGDVPALFWAAAGAGLWWLQKRALRRLKRPDLPPLVATALWFHSVLEGIVTGLAFGVSPGVGIAVLAAMTAHLLPEFFAATALLRGAGAKTSGSLAVTFGGFFILYASFLATYQLLPRFEQELPVLLALSGGAFAYVGGVSFSRARPSAPGGGRKTVAFLCGVLLAALFR